MKLRCRSSFHNWSKWRDSGKGKITMFGNLTTDDDPLSQSVLFQEKMCGDCHIKKRRYVKYKPS